MDHEIRNEYLTVAAQEHGAQLTSVKCNGREYLWQADPAVWADHAPNLFPYVARLTDGKYTFEGNTYEMKIHGFVKYMDLKLTEKTSSSMTFELTDNEETRAQFPWAFCYRITYSLEGKTLHVRVNVENRDTKTMYFGEGGHPGFCVPMNPALSYEDYYVELPQAENPVRIGFTDACFRNGKDAAYPLDENRRIHLNHDLFSKDAIVLKDAGQCALIGTEKDSRALKICWTHKCVGIWSRAWEAPYVCIEPWATLPSRDGRIEDFAQQEDLIALAPGETYSSEWSVEVL